MELLTITEMLCLLAIANVTPVLVNRILGRRWAYPVDFGLTIYDHRPLFGSSKTFRGLLFSVLATSVGAQGLGMTWTQGASCAVFAMIGDLFSSFCKRRLGLHPGSRATGLDQIPESLLPLLALRSSLHLSALDIIVTVSAFMVGEMIFSIPLFKLHLREHPY